MTNAELVELSGEAGNFTAKVIQHPRFIDLEKCTSCGECANICPINLADEYNQGLNQRKAAFKRYAQAIPGAYAISKAGKSPCKVACPAGIAVQGYVNLTAQGRYKEALEVIRRDNPLPVVCGRVCTHPCEEACARGKVEEPIAIRDIKRFLTDWERDNQSFIPPEKKEARPEKVAIIGAGPAGLTAAWYLALEGFPVTIFEALPVAGGMLRVGIPDYRLPPDTLEYEIDCIKSLGVDIKLNTAFGKDMSLADLEAEGYKAVFMGLGAHQCYTLGVEGEDAQGVQPGVTFLRDAALGQAKSPGKQVVVVGGGNVAIDSARTALRLGSEEVTIIYRRTRAEMPAYEDEIEEALEEGIKIEFLVAPVKFLSENGKLTGVEVQRMELGEPDASGRRSPVPIQGSEYVIPIDGALASIGQEPDISCLEEASCTLDVGRKSCLEADPITMQTSIPQVFAGGDAVLGPASAVEAIGQGKEAAISIARFLNGEDLAEGREKDWFPVEPDSSGVAKRARLRPSHADPETRARSWDEVVYVLSEGDAQAEASRCLACAGCAECLLCVDACLAQAVDHSDAARELTLNVGATVLAPGVDIFDPVLYGEDLRYGINPDVVTALEFERILSPSGPTMGHLSRPSDHKEPKKIAWLQCVGSRCQNRCTNGYCSSVCCMYAIKQALVAKEHSAEELECVVFNMDIRTFGKDYEKYFNRAGDEGVRFVKSRFHTIYDNPDGPGVRLEYASEDGEYHLDDFDMVVLSVGLQVGPEIIELGRRADIGLDHYNFAETVPFAPVSTSRPGVFVSGTFQGPKDIPSSVTEASAAAAGAGAIMAPAKWSETKVKELPPQMDVEGLEPRVGVFVCKCGINIAGVVDVPEVAEYAAGLPYVVHADDGLFVCSQDVQENMKEAIKEHQLNRVVVASCSPKTHEAIFMDTLGSVGLNKFLFEMANIRNHDSWVHGQEPGEATAKAKDLVRMAVARASMLKPLSEKTVPVNSRALVIGGGIAGMSAALSLAEQGFEAVLVEREPQLGGFARNLVETIEGENVNEFVDDLIAKVEANQNIQVLVQSLVTGFAGYRGNFTTELVVGPGMYERKVNHGALIIATGANEYKPEEFAYGRSDRVMTQVELSQRLEEKGAGDLESVLMIQCVGSRNAENPNCSRICCQSAVKNALHIKEQNPETLVAVLFRDIRTYGLMEDYYTEARKQGVLFFRFPEDNPPVVEESGGEVSVTFRDHVLDREIRLSPDLLVLSAGMRPADTEELGNIIKLGRNPEGYLLEAHVKLRPVDMATDGVYVCGTAHGPKLISETVAQAMAAASRAATLLSQDELQLSPITSRVDPDKCATCLVCVLACPYGVPEIKDDRTSYIDEALCRGCGICAAECPAKAIELSWYEDDQIMSQVDALMEGALR